MRNPPKHVISISTQIVYGYVLDIVIKVVDDMTDSLEFADADCDYLDIYAHGPLQYREASERNARTRKMRAEARKAVKSAYL